MGQVPKRKIKPNWHVINVTNLVNFIIDNNNSNNNNKKIILLFIREPSIVHYIEKEWQFYFLDIL